MSYSKISICNLALAIVGADAIRDFDEGNKRSRMADVFYEPVKDYVLTRMDWSFARRFSMLNKVITATGTIPPGYFAYQLPNNCKTPRELIPLGSRDPWEILGDLLICLLDSEQGDNVGLYYTATGTSVARFTDPFVNTVALGIAVKLAPPITQDAKVTEALYEQFTKEMKEAWEADANIGNRYREYDETPENDTFVNPDLANFLNIPNYKP